MSNTDTNLSPEKKGESTNKNLAVEKNQQEMGQAKEKRQGIFVDINLLNIPKNDKIYPYKYRHLTYESIPGPFMKISLIIPTPIFDLYCSNMRLFSTDYDSGIDYLQQMFLDYLASDIRDQSKSYVDSTGKLFLENSLELLNSVDELFLIDQEKCGEKNHE